MEANATSVMETATWPGTAHLRLMHPGKLLAKTPAMGAMARGTGRMNAQRQTHTSREKAKEQEEEERTAEKDMVSRMVERTAAREEKDMEEKDGARTRDLARVKAAAYMTWICGQIMGHQAGDGTAAANGAAAAIGLRNKVSGR